MIIRRRRNCLVIGSRSSAQILPVPDQPTALLLCSSCAVLRFNRFSQRSQSISGAKISTTSILIARASLLSATAEVDDEDFSPFLSKMLQACTVCFGSYSGIFRGEL